MLNRLILNWVYGGALAGLLLLLMAPMLVGTWEAAFALTFLHLPVYMLHQLEEHDADRFRNFFNSTIGKGRELLTHGMVFIVNVPGVWGVIAVALYLAIFKDLGFALIAVYLVLVNAFVHAAHALIFKCYNPGLISALLVFVPFGVYSLETINATGAGTREFHIIGFVTAFAIHAAILVYVKVRMVKLGKA